MSAGTTRELIAALAPWIDELFPDGERGARLIAALEERFGADDRAVDAERCAEVEAVAHRFARHVELAFVADGSLRPDATAPGWDPEDPAEVRARAASVRLVERRADGIAVLALDGLHRADVAAPYVEAAFALLGDCRALVLDLRANGGGAPATAALVLDHLLGGEAHISDVVYAERTRQWWTAGTARELPSTTPVVGLIGPGTFSSGEALAYHLQARGRARLVGEATPGAADHVTPIRVTPHVRALLPEAYVRDAVTHANWEGVGVRPDVACAAGEALATGVALANTMATRG